MRLNIILAILLVLTTFSFASSVENKINRPWKEALWERNNQHIYVDFLVFGTLYDPCYMDKTLMDLDMGKVGELGIADEGIAKSVDGARLYARLFLDSSSDLCAACTDIHICAGPVCLALESDNWLAFRLTGVDEVLGCIYSITYMNEYGTNWKSTMDNALDALEKSLDAADESVEATMTTYAEMRYMGICDEDYSREPRNACLNISYAVSVIESKDTEVNYEKYNLLLDYESNISDEVWNDIPDMSLYYPAMELVWSGDGIVATFDLLNEQGQTAISDAENIYKTMKSETDSLKKPFDTEFGKLENQRLDLITESVLLEGVEGARMATIADRYAQLEKEKEDAENAYDDAVNAYSAKTQSYLKYATDNMSLAKTMYADLGDKAVLLLDDTEGMVESLKAEAEGKINKARSEAESLGITNRQLEEAEAEFAAGNSARYLGEKYVHYARANELAETASGDWTLSDAAEIQSLIYELDDLIERAEGDGLNVAGEKGELDLLKRNTGSEDILIRLDALKQGILAKAKMVYGDLETTRALLLEKLMLADAEDLLDDMRAAEAGIVFNGRIDYENGLGRLSGLRTAYEEIEDEAEAEPEIDNAAVSKSIVTDVSLVIGKVKIDEPTDVSLNILFKNTRDYWGEDVEVAVPLPGDFGFDYFDITEGADEVTGLKTQRNTLYVVLRFVDSHDTKSITFEKSQVLAMTKSRSSSATGLGDGSARVEESITFDLSVIDAFVEVPQPGATDIRIDDLPANRPLSKGIHTITADYIEDDAYSEQRSDATTSTSGTETTVSYTITVTPYMDLDSIPVIAEIEESDYITKVDILCTVSCTEESAPQGKIVELFNLEKDSAETVEVSYTVSKLDDYAKEEFDRIEGISNEPEIVSLIEEARSLLALGDYEGALLKIEMIKKKASETDKTKSTLIRKHSELVRDLAAELDDIDAALSRANESGAGNHSLLDRLETRKAELEALMAGNISSTSLVSEIQDAINELERVDKNWLKKQVSAFKNDATKQLNKYRVGFADYDNATADELLEALEHDINVLAATEKAEDAVQVISDLQQADKMEQELEAEKLLATEELRIDFEILKEDIEETLAKYSSEAKSARGTGVEQLFTISESTVTKLVSDIEKGLGAKSNDYVEDKVKDLEKLNKKMVEILYEEKSAAERKLNTVKSVYSEKKDSIPEEDRAYVSEEISEIETLLVQGQYAAAISRGDKLVETINKALKEDNNFVFLLVASVIVLAMVIVYIIRQQPKKPRIKLEKEE